MEKIDSLETAFNYISNNFNFDMFTLKNCEKEEYDNLLNELIKTNSSEYSTAEKGIALENIVNFLINKTGVFEIYANVRTNTNELDQLIKCNEKGNFLVSNGLFNFRLKHFIGECKNYKSTVSVTYVGKICSLLTTTQNKLCILFSYNGVSGKGWNNASGLVKKFYLAKEKEEERYCIIDFNINDFIKIKNGDNLIKIIDDKIFALQNDVNYTNLITSHKSEFELKSLQEI